jgi:hypothetical protein
MAYVFAAICLAGFAQSYWFRIATGTFSGAPIFHVHGLLLFGWTCLYVLQTTFAATGRMATHRAWGLLGIAWFSVTMCSTLVVTIHSMRVADSSGAAALVLPILSVSLVTIALASALFAAAIANVHRPEVHKRLMLLVMVVLVQAAVARLVVLPFAPPGPPSLQTTVLTGLATDFVVVVALLHDWRTRGRPHHVYVWGGMLLLAIQVLGAPLFARSEAAVVTARALLAFLG